VLLIIFSSSGKLLLTYLHYSSCDNTVKIDILLTVPTLQRVSSHTIKLCLPQAWLAMLRLQPAMDKLRRCRRTDEEKDRRKGKGKGTLILNRAACAKT
jgi:hypothetical protein